MDEEQDSRKYTRLAGVWTQDDGTEWLVDFYLTELDGQLECVGMNVRSFVLPDERDIACRWGALPKGSASAGKEMISPEATALHRRGGGVTPRPLRTAVLRANLLGKFLPEMIVRAGDSLTWLADRHEELGNTEVAERLRSDPITQDEPRRGGRPRKYTDEDYVRAADAYRRARLRRSPAPYKDVATELELKSKRPGGNRAIAGKLIIECRRRGLLPKVPEPAPKAKKQGKPTGKRSRKDG
jgi:hypothetical protein